MADFFATLLASDEGENILDAYVQDLSLENDQANEIHKWLIKKLDKLARR